MMWTTFVYQLYLIIVLHSSAFAIDHVCAVPVTPRVSVSCHLPAKTEVLDYSCVGVSPMSFVMSRFQASSALVRKWYLVAIGFMYPELNALCDVTN